MLNKNALHFLSGWGLALAYMFSLGEKTLKERRMDAIFGLMHNVERMGDRTLR